MWKNIIPSAFFFLIGFSLLGQVPTRVVLDENMLNAASSRAVCPDNVPSSIAFVPNSFQGNSNDVDERLQEITFLCAGDLFLIEKTGGTYDGDPDPDSPSGTGFAFYSCEPTIDGPNLQTVVDDNCIINDPPTSRGLYIFIDDTPDDNIDTFQNNTSIISLPDFFGEQLFWFAPITYDEIVGGEPEYEDIIGAPPGSCVTVDIDAAFPVVYLNEISISDVLPDMCTGSFVIDGGMPEYAASNPSFTSDLMYDIEITNTTTGAVVPNSRIRGSREAGSTIEFDVTSAGLYTIQVSDGKSCSLQANINMSACPLLPSISIPCSDDPTQMDASMPLAGSVLCLDLQVSQFNRMAGAQFGIEWDTSIMTLTRGNVTPNDQVPNISIAIGFQNIDDGVLLLAWNTDDFIDGTTLDDGTSLFTMCFETKRAGNPNLEITDAATIEFVDIGDNEIIFDVSDICPIDIAPPPSTLELASINITQPCEDENNGKLELIIRDPEGTPPYRLDLIGNQAGPLPNIEITDFTTEDNGLVIANVLIENLAPDTYSYSIEDATGSSTATSIFDGPIVIRAANLVANIIPEQPQCFGEASGTLTAIPLEDATSVPNIEEYSFLWSNNDTTQEITGLPPGGYEVTVTNPNGCTATIQNNLGQPRELTISTITTLPATCSGSFDGALRAFADGGTGTLTYRWDVDTTFNSAEFGSLDVGTYQLTVTDENGCIAGGTASVESASTITLTPAIDPISCTGETDASITVQRAFDGFPQGTEFSFDWFTDTDAVNFEGDRTGNLTSANDLAPGTYFVSITVTSTTDSDLSACSAIEEYVIEDPLPITIEAAIDATTNCRTPDGRIELSVTGGTGDYLFEWEFTNEDTPVPSNTATLATNLPPDSVTVMVTDANNCLAIIDTVIASPTPPTVIEFVDNSLLCADDTDGTLQIIAEPEDADITSYRWSHNSSITGNFAGSLSPDTFVVAVIDANFCETLDTAVVSSPPPITFNNIDTLQIPCFEEANGSLQIEVNGGMPSYEFNWLDAENEVVATNTFILDDVGEGVYTIKGTDANACDFEANITLPSLPEIRISFSNIRGTSCFDNGLNERDGEVTAMVSYADGTTGEFDFFWPTTAQATGVSQDRVTNLGSGEIELLVFETNGICAAKNSVSIPSPERLEQDPIQSSSTNITCNGGEDGEITVAAMGGTSPYTYIWDFENSTSTTISNLSQGTYTVTFTDANDCIETNSVSITEPDPLILDLDFNNNNTRDVVCPDDETGQITILASGANIDQGNIIYSWQNNIASGPVATDLAPGNYSVTVTDALGCFDSISYTVNQPPPIQFSIGPSMDIQCNGGVTAIVADPLSFSGGNGGDYTFSVDNSPAQTLDRVIQVRAGEHAISVFDAAGCEFEETLNIEEPLPINIEFPIAEISGNNFVAEVELGGELALNPDIFSPLPIVNLIWSANPQDTSAIFICNDPAFCDNPTVSLLDNTTYTLSIVDQNGCTAEESILIEVDKNRNIFIPNAFAPNARGFDLNETFRIYAGVGVEMVQFARVFDRWGAMVASIDTPTLPTASGLEVWDGKIGGQRAPQGVYVYIVSVTFADNTTLLYRGDVTVLR